MTPPLTAAIIFGMSKSPKRSTQEYLDQCDDDLNEHWAAPFYTFLPKRIEDMDQKCHDRITLIQLDACKKLLKMIGPRKQEFPDLVEKARGIIFSPEASIVQKVGASVILDYCAEGWRDDTPLEVLGTAVQRDDPLVFAWRKGVLERDSFTCQKCGSKDNLHAHHLVRWVDMPEARLIPENGVTLCVKCHYAAHGKVYRG